MPSKCFANLDKCSRGTDDGWHICVPCYRALEDKEDYELLDRFKPETFAEASPAQLNDEITDDKRMNDGPKEELFLSLSHGDAIFAVGYEDNGSDLSEGFLERRRGQYARLGRVNYSPA